MTAFTEQAEPPSAGHAVPALMAVAVAALGSALAFGLAAGSR